MLPIRQSLVFLLIAIIAALPAHAGSKPPQIFLHANVQTSGEGLGPTQATNIPLPPNGEMIQIRFLPDFTERNIIDVKTDEKGSVYLYLDHQGKVNLDAVTGENQGRILVITINGYVVYAPVIDEQISNGIFVIPHPLPPEVIQLLQQTAKRNVKDGPPQLPPST
jgi:hypothetical protein